MPIALDVGEVHSQIPWISSLGLKAGVLADTLAILMTNLVAWISFLIMVYSTGYMHGDKDLTRYWFLMLFFIGSMQLIVLSDNLLMVFFGWEGVGLASYALIGFWYYDRKKDYVGVEGQIAGGIPNVGFPHARRYEGFPHDPCRRRYDARRYVLNLHLLWDLWITRSWLEDTAWATAMSQQNLLVPADVLLFGGAVGKSAQFPLNEWLLEAMTGPTAVSALIHAANNGQGRCFLGCAYWAIILCACLSGSLQRSTVL